MMRSYQKKRHMPTELGMTGRTNTRGGWGIRWERSSSSSSHSSTTSTTSSSDSSTTSSTSATTFSYQQQEEQYHWKELFPTSSHSSSTWQLHLVVLDTARWCVDSAQLGDRTVLLLLYYLLVQSIVIVRQCSRLGVGCSSQVSVDMHYVYILRFVEKNIPSRELMNPITLVFGKSRKLKDCGINPIM